MPEPLGFDATGCEILSFMEGDVPHDTPAWLWAPPLLAQIAHALRQFHDATVSFESNEARWQLTPRMPHEVICHNDFAPYNTVFINGQFAALIDFDTCAPGPRIWDIAYTAYRFIPLLPAAGEIDDDSGCECAPMPWNEQMTRLLDFLRAYAGETPELHYAVDAVLAQTARRLEALAAFSNAAAEHTQRPELARHARMYRAHAAWLRQRATEHAGQYLQHSPP
ncbi:MAG: phosphotransferase [Uliginosibacterium sp.]|nr:phosphotransferase [Uliginosibacterium sp.]